MGHELPVAEDAYRRFKRVLYGDAVSDWTGVYEAWWLANAEFPKLTVSERLRLAEVAVAELTGAGLVELYRGTWEDRPGEPIPRDEYDAVLREWATWTNPPDDPTIIFVGGEEPADWEAVFGSL